jgi:uncharacterized protein (TIGR02271 family)
MTQKTSAQGGTVVGLFRERRQAEQAIQELKREKFADNQIGVIMQDQESQKELADSTGTKAAEGAASGAIGGGVAGGVLGLLAGVGALAIPGIGPIVAAGALASTLAGAGIGAAAGGLLGALVGMGVPEEDAQYFEKGLKSGGILVTVEAGARSQEARQILRGRGAELEAVPQAATSAATGSTDGEQRIELREEELQAETERVQAGEVRLRKEVVNDTKTIEVPVTREEVVVERHSVSGRQTSDQNIGDNEEIRIPLMEEEVRVEKTPVVREEVSVSKRAVQETRQVSDTVRREEARIEQTGGASVSSEGGSAGEPWRGSERRYRHDSGYSGPERRVARV